MPVVFDVDGGVAVGVFASGVVGVVGLGSGATSVLSVGEGWLSPGISCISSTESGASCSLPAVVGLVFLLMRSYWIKILTADFYKRKFKIAEGFRKK